MPKENASPLHKSGTQTRQRAMAVLASAETDVIEARLSEIRGLPESQNVRTPEAGLVMVRGRVGGDGAAFNLGEATVSRAAVKLASGEIGVGYALGRDTKKAHLIAFCDALLQTGAFDALLDEQLIVPLHEAQRGRDTVTAERAAATRVDFFTLVRGED